MKKSLRRLMAMLLSASMVASMVGVIPALAGKETSEDQIENYLGDEDYYAYYTLDEDGNKVVIDGEAVVSDTSYHYADGDNGAKVEVYKTISTSDPDTTDTFDIELKVVTTETLTPKEFEPNAAVVLVIDNSSSMYQTIADASGTTAPSMNGSDSNKDGYVDTTVNGNTVNYGYTSAGLVSYGGGNYDYEGETGPNGQVVQVSNGRIPLNSSDEWRITIARDAATSFVNSFASDSATREIAVVSFSEGAVIETGDGTAAGGWVTQNDAIDAIADISPEGATDIASGLEAAVELLSETDIPNKYVVLLSDGSPNWYGDNWDTASGNHTIWSYPNAAAADIKTSATLYTMGFSSQAPSQLKEMATNEDCYFTSTDKAGLTAAFDSIIKNIQSLADAWEVTDPMGDFIILDTESVEDNNAVTYDADGTITWDLKADTGITVGNETTYTMTYTITLDTANEDFEEDIFYLTNGYTSLKYYWYSEVFNEEGEVVPAPGVDLAHTIDFLVPAVEGEIPEIDYLIKHYLQTGFTEGGDATYVAVYGTYPDDPEKTVNGGKIELWDTAPAPDKLTDGLGYSTYSYSHGDGNGAQITPDDNVLELFYNWKLTEATVNHNYYTVTITDSDVDVQTDTPSTVTEKNLHVGTDHTYDSAQGNYTYWTTDKPAEDGTYTLYKTGEVTKKLLEATAETPYPNVVDYYYVNVIDQRTDISVTVNHRYTDYEYTVGADGQLELTPIDYSPNGNPNNSTKTYTTAVDNIYKGDPFAAPQDTKDDTYDYVDFDSSDINALLDGDSVKLTSLQQDHTTITLNYENVPALPKDIEVIVNHIYEYVTQYYDQNGALQSTDPIEEARYSQDEDDYPTKDGWQVGETFTADEDTDYGDYDYTTNYGTNKTTTLVIQSLVDGENVINIYYVRVVEPTTVTVNHTYQLYMDIIDEDGDFQEKVLIEAESPYDHSEEDINLFANGNLLYPGDTYTATPDGIHSDYTVTDDTVIFKELTDNKSENVINLFYERYERLGVAEVTVTHTYYTYHWDYVGGRLQIVDTDVITPDDDSTLKYYYEGHNGESYDVEILRNYGEDTYTLNTAGYASDAPDFTVRLKENSPQYYDFIYERNVYDYVETGVTVNHHYETVEYYVDPADGQLKDRIIEDRSEQIVEILANEDPTDVSYYAGQSYTAPEGNTTDYNIVNTTAHPYQPTVVLDSGENVIDLYYTRDSYPDTVEVQVIHTYHRYTTTVENGQLKEDYDRSSWTYTETETYYVGQTYDPQPETRGYQQTTDLSIYEDQLLVPGMNTFYIDYEISDDLSTPATLQVWHEYTTVYTSGKADDVDVVDGGYTSDSYIGALLAFTDIPRAGFDITDVIVNEDDATLTTRTIQLDRETNVVTIKYLKTDDDIIYVPVNVTHYYKTIYQDVNGDVIRETNDGTFYEATKLVDLAQETYTADWVSEYNDTYYPDRSGDRTIQLSADGENLVELYYEIVLRETEDPEDDPTDDPSTPKKYYDLTVKWVDEDGNELDDSEITKNMKSGTPYDTDKKSFDGYTFVGTEGDKPSGYMTSNKEVIYVYERDEITDVPDEDVPLVETPDDGDPDTTPPEEPDSELTDVPEEDVPLFDLPDLDIPLIDIPQTGDARNVYLLLATALLSAAGLLWLVHAELKDRKRNQNS